MMKIKLFRFEVNNASCHLFEDDKKDCWANRLVKEEQEQLVSEEMIETIINDFIKDKKVIDIKINNIDVHYHNNGYDNRIQLVYTVIYGEKEISKQ